MELIVSITDLLRRCDPTLKDMSDLGKLSGQDTHGRAAQEERKSLELHVSD